MLKGTPSGLMFCACGKNGRTFMVCGSTSESSGSGLLPKSLVGTNGSIGYIAASKVPYHVAHESAAEDSVGYIQKESALAKSHIKERKFCALACEYSDNVSAPSLSAQKALV